MTTKQAIAWCEKTLGKDDWPEVFIIIAALRASQKRERDMFKRLSRRCEEQVGGGALCTMNTSNAVSCTMRTCPLLKPVEKPISDCKKKGKK